MLLTKLSAFVVGIVVVVAVLLAESRWSRRIGFIALTAGWAVLASSWWLLRNQVEYGDPLAVSASEDYLRPRFGLGYGRNYGAVRILLHDVPERLYRTLWFVPTVWPLQWVWWAYIPLWALLCAALAGLLLPRRGSLPTGQDLVLLATMAIAAIMLVCVVALQTTTFAGRLAFVGLPAVACLAALGLERVRMPLVFRFVLPVVGLVALISSIRTYVIGVFY